MCRNLFLKRTSRSKQHSSPNEAFSLNNSSEQQSAKQAEHLEQKGAFLRHFCGSILRAIFKVCLCTLGCLSLAIFLGKSVRCEKRARFLSECSSEFQINHLTVFSPNNECKRQTKKVLKWVRFFLSFKHVLNTNVICFHMTKVEFCDEFYQRSSSISR